MAGELERNNAEETGEAKEEGKNREETMQSVLRLEQCDTVRQQERRGQDFHEIRRDAKYRKYGKESERHAGRRYPPTGANHLKEEESVLGSQEKESVTFILLQLHLTCHYSHLLPLSHNHTHTHSPRGKKCVFPDWYSDFVHAVAHAYPRTRTLSIKVSALLCSYTKSCS